VSGLLGAAGVLPRGAQGVSQARLPTPLPLPPTSAFPPPPALGPRRPNSVRSPELRENEKAVAAAASLTGRGTVIRFREPLTGEDEAFMVEFTSGKIEQPE
jgi:hypothetical protein